MDKVLACSGLEWDDFNIGKNVQKHNVTPNETEQIFFNKPLIVKIDEKHSQNETRYYALGKTDIGRKLFVVFTVRGELIRVISARAMSKKERMIYEKEENTKI
jgi:uncharacterized DUF497 family protein